MAWKQSSQNKMSDEDRERLISIVKQYPFLYDPKDEDFLSYAKKQRTWAEVGAEFNITAEEANDRWRGMKDRYYYVKRRESLPPSWKTPARKYKYYDQLMFLDDCMQEIHWNPLKERLRHIPKNSRWTKLHTSILVEELQNNPLLYDKAHPLYYNEAQRHEALGNIFGKLRPFISQNMTPQFLERRIRELKFQYHKEKICIKMAARYQKKCELPYEPKLWCFDRLGFLDDTRATAKKKSATLKEDSEMEIEPSGDERNIDNSNDPFNNFGLTDTLEETETLNLNQTHSDVHLKCSKIVECLSNEMENSGEDNQGCIGTVDCDQTRSNLHKSCSRLLESLANKMENHKSDKDNRSREEQTKPPHTLLRQLVESELSTISKDIFVDAKREILQVLKEASKKSLREKMKASLTARSTSSFSPNQFYNLDEQQTEMAVPSVHAGICSNVQTLHLDVIEMQDEQITNYNFSFM